MPSRTRHIRVSCKLIFMDLQGRTNRPYQWPSHRELWHEKVWSFFFPPFPQKRKTNQRKEMIQFCLFSYWVGLRSRWFSIGSAFFQFLGLTNLRAKWSWSPWKCCKEKAYIATLSEQDWCIYDLLLKNDHWVKKHIKSWGENRACHLTNWAFKQTGSSPDNS